MDSIRLGSKSYNVVALISNPSIMKVGRFGLSFRLDFERSLASSLSKLPMPDCPRIYISGTALGFEPIRLLSTILNEGSKVCMALRTLVLEAFINSSFLMVTEFPVKDSCLMFAKPVTTTVEMKWTSSSSVMFNTWLFVQVFSTSL